VGRVLDGAEQVQEGLGHKRSGEFLVLAAPGAWFEYGWWEEPGQAPEYAFTVDIHRKIGYDPLELIFDHEKGGISLDSGRIKGSHGMMPKNELDWPVIINPWPEIELDEISSTLSPLAVPEVIFNGLERLG
jgi:hypothetical protein